MAIAQINAFTVRPKTVQASVESVVSPDFEDPKPSISNLTGGLTADDMAKQLAIDMRSLNQKILELRDELDQIKSDSNRNTFKKYRDILLDTLKSSSFNK